MTVFSAIEFILKNIEKKAETIVVRFGLHKIAKILLNDTVHKEKNERNNYILLHTNANLSELQVL
jgi:hypothetical protein